MAHVSARPVTAHFAFHAKPGRRETVGLFCALAGLAAAAAVLAGCATTPQEKPSLRTLIQPLEVRVYVPQADLYVPYDPSWKAYLATAPCYLAIWLCPAAAAVSSNIDAGDIKEADTLAGPMKEAIADIPFGTRFTDALSGQLAANDLRVQSALVVRSATERMNEQAFEDATAGSVLFAGVRYAVSPDFSRIEIASRTEVFARSEPSRRALGLNESLGDDPIRGSVLSRANALYVTDFHYVAALPEPAESAEENARRWARDGGRWAREAILLGIEQATRAVARDFGTRLWSGAQNLPETTTRDGKSARLVEEIPGKGRLLRLASDRLLFEAGLAIPGQAAR